MEKPEATPKENSDLINLIYLSYLTYLSYFIYFIINNSFISSLTQETAFRKGITLEKCSLRHNVFYEGFRGVS
ncbi:hypothetical protein EEK96_20675 [Escherichia coli]|nr:hypothetical protein [Escherichia coli]EFA4327173.1 hypothetical protein [Escherichia coli]EFB1904732.1 hypothetical protein [Escherichia coli]EFB2094806.1 hypothetical protein [Escherichia coli]EFB5280909.1 hypothetical protein [Escherichia coli]